MNKFFISFYVIAISISACTSCSTKNYVADVSKIKVELKTERFDKEFLSLAKTNDVYGSILNLQNKYGDFFKFYLQEILSINYISDTSHALADSIVGFFKNQYYLKVFDTTVLVYNNVENINSKLTEGFRHFIFYFPEINVPTIIYYLNGPRAFTYGTVYWPLG